MHWQPHEHFTYALYTHTPSALDFTHGCLQISSCSLFFRCSLCIAPEGRKSDYGKNVRSVCCVIIGIIRIFRQRWLFFIYSETLKLHVSEMSKHDEICLYVSNIRKNFFVVHCGAEWRLWRLYFFRYFQHRSLKNIGSGYRTFSATIVRASPNLLAKVWCRSWVFIPVQFGTIPDQVPSFWQARIELLGSRR